MQLGSLSPDLHSFPHILLDVFLSIISKMAQNDPKKSLFTKHNPAGEAGLLFRRSYAGFIIVSPSPNILQQS